MAGNFTHIAVLLSTSFLVACGGDAAEPAADRVFLNGAIYTMDANRSWAEAVAISGSEIIFVGESSGVEALLGPDTEVTDLGGYMLLPGFHDSHVHILIGVYTDKDCSLELLETPGEIALRLAKCTGLEGYGDERWVFGGGWLDWVFPEANPDKEFLDRYFPDRPAYLESSYGHSAWVNSRALELAGIGLETPDPPAGVIERDPETGEATGTLRDAAMLLVLDQMPPMPFERDVESVRLAIEYANSFGITSVIEPGFDTDMMTPLLAVDERGELSLRSMIALSPINWQPGRFGDEIFDLLEKRENWRRPNIDVDAIKIYMDGVIEYGTAYMLEEYDVPEWGNGLRFYEQQEVNSFLTDFDAMGINIQVHAIGDAGIRMALDGFEAMRKTNGHDSANRHQVVHLQLIDDAEISRFGELDIGANFQSLWAYPDESVIDLAVPAIGEDRARRMYPISRVAAAGGRIVGGSDYFVTSINPLLAIEVGITRMDPYSRSGPTLNTDESVDLETMLDAYTINGAWQMGLEDVQGSIEVGKRADLVILDRNLFEIPPSEISEAVVMETVFDGRTVYKRTSN